MDSDAHAATAIATALRECGWHVQTASTVAEARRNLHALKPQIVLLDIWQPDGSGIALVRELADRADVGIIVVSACCQVEDRVVGLELGADAYITKPFSPRELTARVRALDRRLTAQPPSVSPARVAHQRKLRSSILAE